MRMGREVLVTQPDPVLGQRATLMFVEIAGLSFYTNLDTGKKRGNLGIAALP